MAVTASIVAVHQHAGRSWRKIMTRYPSSKGKGLQDRELHDDELNAVTGGIIAVLIGLLLSDARPSTPPPPPSK
jgi:hypothetical protein